MSFSVSSGSDVAKAQTSPEDGVLPSWGAWVVACANQASDIVVCGCGAAVVGQVIHARRLAGTVHVIETDALMVAAQASSAQEESELTHWAGVDSFTTFFAGMETPSGLGV